MARYALRTFGAPVLLPPAIRIGPYRYMTQKRANTSIKTNIYMQIDENEDMRIKSNMGGAEPSFSHWGYTIGGVVDIRLGDLLVDQNADIAGQINSYRVAGRPEHFDLDHTEVPIDLIVKT